MKKYDIAILTEKKHLTKRNNDTLNFNVLLEDNYVKAALEKLNIKVTRVSWDDPVFDWTSTKYILFRSTWDYFDRYPEFSIWLNKVSKQTHLLNSESTIRWNIDKHYLLDLQKKGLHICESHFIQVKETKTLQELANTHQLTDFVLKPCISGNGRHTYKINQNNIAEHEAIFLKLITKEAMILQPFQHNIIHKGEVSLIIIGGKFTHAVLKIAKKGDFRVQDDYGGTVLDYTPSQQEIIFAEKAVKACKEPPIYARVDIFTDNNHKLALAELELIEPELWFRKNPIAAEELAKAIQQLIHQ